MVLPADPDPIVQDFRTMEVAKEQPYIYRLSKLGVEATRRGRGVEFADRVAALIFGCTRGSNQGDLLGDAVADALEAGDTSAERLGAWAPDFIRGMERMRRLVVEFYDGFNFGKFVKRHPHLKGHITDMLIGDLFNERVDEIVAPLDEMRREEELKRTAAVSG